MINLKSKLKNFGPLEFLVLSSLLFVVVMLIWTLYNYHGIPIAVSLILAPIEAIGMMPSVISNCAYFIDFLTDSFSNFNFCLFYRFPY